MCSLKWFTKISKKIGFRRQSHLKSFLASQLERFADNKISPVILRGWAKPLPLHVFFCLQFRAFCKTAMTREEGRYVAFYHWWNHYIALPHIFSLVCHSKHWKLAKALYKMKPTSEYYHYTLIYSKLTWKIKLIFTLLIRCKFMCCSQHFTTYLLSLQNILYFDWRRASYIILSIYMLD